MKRLIPEFLSFLPTKQTNYNAGIFFGDLTGFTNLTEHFMHQGKIGIEKLTFLINDIFSGIDLIINKNGGYIYNYSGDAFFAVFFDKFNPQKIDNEIRNFIDHLPIIDLSQKEKVKIAVKTGYSVGEINIEFVKIKKREVLCVYGNPVREAANLKKILKPLNSNNFIKNSHYDEKKYVSSNKILNIKSEFRTCLSFFVKLYFKGKFNKIFIGKVLNLIESKGGFFNEIEYGDKGFVIPAFFGIPKMKIDYADKAVECGIQIVKLAKERGEECKIGISLGKVLSGLIGGDNLLEYTAIGDRVNTAARLMSKAEKNSVYTDKKTLNFLKVYSNFIGNIHLKGKKEKIKVYRIKNIIKSKRENIFIGREKELEKIKFFLEQSNNDVLGIYGEAGIGKTYLVEHFLDILGSRKLFFASYLTKENIDFDNFINGVLRKVSLSYNIVELLKKNRNKEEFETFLYFIQKKEITIQELEKLDEKEKEKIKVNAVIEILNAVDKEKIFFIDDANFSDERFSNFFENLLNKCKNVKLIGTFRGKRDENNCFKNIEMIELNLTPFNEQNVVEFLEKTGIVKLNNKIKNEIYRKTEGIPFYVLQISDYLKKVKDLKNIGELDIKLEAIILSKFDYLSREVKNFLKIAAVYGKIFDIETVSRLLAQREIMKTVSISMDENIIDIINEFIYIFKHSIFRDTIYQLQLKKELILLHGKIAALLEKVNSDKLDLLAYHYESSEKNDKAAKYYYKLSEVEIQKGYYNNAVNYLKKCLKLCKKGSLIYHKAQIDISNTETILGNWRSAEKILLNETKKCKINKLSGEIYSSLVELYIQKGDYENAALFIKRLKNSKSHKFDYYILSGRNYYYLRKNELSEKMYKKALKYATDEDKQKIYSNLGALKNQMSNFDEAVIYGKNALDIAKKNNNLRGMGKIYVNLGNSYFYMNKYHYTLRYYKKSLEIAKKLGDYLMTTILLSNIGSLYHNLHKIDKAKSYLSEGLNLTKKNNDKSHYALIAGNLASIDAYCGNFPRGMKLLKNALRIRREINDPKGISVNLSNIAGIYYEQKEYKKAFEAISESVKLSEEIKLYYWLPSHYDILFKVAYELKDYKSIQKDLNRIIKLAETHKFRGDIFNLKLTEAKLNGKLNNVKKMKKSLDEAKKLAQGVTENITYYEIAYELTSDKKYIALIRKHYNKLDKKSYQYKRIKKTIKI